MKIPIRNYTGFTLVELLLIMAIMLTLLGFVTLNLSSVERSTTQDTTIQTLISDLKEAQTKAMVGDTEGRSTHDSYGAYFESGRYTIFHGTTFSSGAPDNFVTNLNNNTQFLNVGSSVVFATVSGEILNYSSGANTITLQETTTGVQKVIQFNRYGVITSVN